jgi:LPXTG-site transpeptidase (sortase) family protein
MPTLGVVAPVVLGSSASVLADAVGLEPASAPPGDTGTTILAAHDVTWFSGIDQLHVGNRIVVDVACRELDYQVTGHQVTTEGSPVVNVTKGNELVLVTCWPTDALWLTNKRYLVTATLVSTKSTVAPVAPTVPTSPLVAPEIAGLSPAELTATANQAPLGALTESGSPARSWIQSPAPLQVEQAALEAFFATERSAATGNGAALAELAAGPAVELPHDVTPLLDATVTHYWSTVSLDLDVDSTTVQRVTIATRVAVSGGAQPGLYDVEVIEIPIGDTLHIESWQMAPY